MGGYKSRQKRYEFTSRTGRNPAAILYLHFDNRSRSKKMKIWFFVTVLLSIEGAMSFQRAAQTCHPFSATSVAIMNQNIDGGRGVSVDDPQLTFFRDIMKFRDDAIQHTLEDAIKFFNETYGLDFSLSPPTDQNEYFYQNA